MKIRHAASAVSVVLTSLLAVPPSADAQQRETRPLDGFDAIQVGGGIDLFLRQGTPFVVEVEAEDEVAEIVTEVRNRTLEIRRKSSFSFFDWGGDHGAVHVTLPVLASLTASGGSDVRAEGTFTSDRVQLVASGGSDLEIAVAAGTLDAEASGGSDLRLRGSARSASMRSSGGSDLNAGGLTVDEADVRSSGGSDVSIGVRNKIVAHASGGSDLAYSGEPTVVDINASGGADVRRR